MGWREVSKHDDLIVLERQRRGYISRIEARLDDEKWIVYNTCFNEKGLNVTEDFEARTKDEAIRIMDAIKKKPTASLQSLTERMLKQRKRTEVKIKRSYKEYNVEKWFFSINDGDSLNFVVLRFCDQVDVDFVIHQRYKHLESKVIKAILATLGLSETEDELYISCYYFNHTSRQHIEGNKQKLMLGKFEIGLSDE